MSERASNVKLKPNQIWQHELHTRSVKSQVNKEHLLFCPTGVGLMFLEIKSKRPDWGCFNIFRGEAMFIGSRMRARPKRQFMNSGRKWSWLVWRQRIQRMKLNWDNLVWWPLNTKANKRDARRHFLQKYSTPRDFIEFPTLQPQPLI